MKRICVTLLQFMEEPLVLDVGKRQILVDRSLTVGRGASADVRFTRDAAMSREHARIVPTNAGCVLEDLGSTNGTFVNGQQVTSPRRLRRGDLVRIGEQEIRVSIARTRLVADEVTASAESHPGIDATRPAHLFDLISSLASDALLAGDHVQGERLAASHLQRLLGDARKGSADSQLVEPAVRLALMLARALADARWLNYILELHEQLPNQVNAALLHEVAELAQVIPGVNLAAPKPTSDLEPERATES